MCLWSDYMLITSEAHFHVMIGVFLSATGWSSRTQFEETWATLLGVLVTQPITIDQEEETPQEVTASSVHRN